MSDVDAVGLSADALSPEARAFLEEILVEAGMVSSDQSQFGRIMSELGSPDASVARLERLLVRDQALSARVLRLANSASFGLSRSVTSLHSAITVVGFTSIRTLTMASAMAWDRVPDRWSEFSLLHAYAAESVAWQMGAPRQEAFSAGLLSDLGRSLLYKVTQGQYELLSDMAEHPDSLPALEYSAYGLTHQHITSEAFARWRFPDELSSAAHCHHDPAEVLSDPLIRAVRVGHDVAAVLQGAEPHLDWESMTDGHFTTVHLDMYEGAIRAQASDLASVIG
jgi:HD-like signal output (HDOD) protein